MCNLPTIIIQQIYEHDSTYNNIFDNVLKQMMAHCFICNGHLCMKKWNNCYW